MSKKLFSSLFLAILLLGFLVQPSSQLFQAKVQRAYAALQAANNNTFLLTASTGDTAALEAKLASIKKSYKVISVKRLSQDSNTVIVTFDPKEDLVMAMATGIDDEVQIEPDYVLKAVAQPTDAQYAEQWSLRNTAQAYHTSASATVKGTNGTDINWQPTFENTKYRGIGVVVAVIDSGVTAHADLSDRLWTNTKESVDGVDNDKNGLIDDVNGWNFVGNNNNFTDNYGHGTQVAGIIAARNDSTGVVGVAPSSKIMSLRVLGDNGSGNTSHVVQAINYAIEKKAKVINMSLGAPYADSVALISACNNAIANGIVIVAAAGNSNQDIVSNHFAPANIDGVMAIGSIGSSGNKSSFSNYGSALALVAPGESIVSTRAGTKGSSNQVLPDGSKNYIIGSGTSFASPIVAGAAALVLEKNPNFSVSQVREQLQKSAKDLGSKGKDNQFGHGLLDISAALGVTITAPQTVVNKAPKISSATWSPSNFNDEKSEFTTLTVKATDANSDTLTVTADLTSLGLATTTLSLSGSNMYVATGIVPNVPSGTYYVAVEVNDGQSTVSKATKLKITKVLPTVTITKPTNKASYSVNKNSVVLSGAVKGPVRQLKINGVSIVGWEPTQPKWSTTVALPLGASTYTVVGYNANNEEVTTKTITITRNR